MGKVILDWDTARSFMEDAFKGVGVPADDAKIVVDVLLESDKRGIESHGCNRFKPIYIDRINDGIQNPVTNFEIIKETPCTAVVDGHDGMGQVIGYKSMQMAIDKAKQYGLGMVVVRNSCHYGIAGYYPSMACKQGCIGITGTNARPSVAPIFGIANARVKALCSQPAPIMRLCSISRTRPSTRERAVRPPTVAVFFKMLLLSLIYDDWSTARLSALPPEMRIRGHCAR